MVCRVAFAKVPDRVSSLPLGATALAAIATGLVVVALSTSPAGVVLGSGLMGVGVAFSTPAFFSAIFATATASERGAASATASVALDLGLGAGPIALGLVAQSGAPRAFGSAAAVALAGSAWASCWPAASRTAGPSLTQAPAACVFRQGRTASSRSGGDVVEGHRDAADSTGERHGCHLSIIGNGE